MRRLIVPLTAAIVVVAASVAPTTARAESPAEARPTQASITWTVQVDPLTTALGIAHVLLERRVNDDWAIYAGPSLRLYDSPLTKDEEEGYKAYGVEFGARRFFGGHAPSGWWAGLRGVVAHLTHESESRIGGYGSVLAGRAWIFADRWVVSAALGVSYFEYNVDGVGVDGVLPAAHTGVGVAF